MRLIDADALNKAIAESRISLHTMRLKLRVSDIILILQHAPTIDAVPVVHARWIYTGEMDEDGNCEANCSHCGAGDKHRADLKDAVPYCWKCGARMDGEADG